MCQELFWPAKTVLLAGLSDDLALGETYEVHRGDFTGRSKVWNASIRVRYLGYDFLAIVHRHEECFVEHAAGVLLDRNALSGADRVCRYTCELV